MLSTSAASRVCFLVLLLIGAGSSARADPNEQATAQPSPPLFSHVCLLVEENHSFRQVVGASDMPYLNGLITNYGLAVNYYANTHPSIGNYFMLTTGRMITGNDNYKKVVKTNNLARIFEAQNLTWKAYVENLPADPTKDSFPYLRHHNPFSFFSDVLSNPAERTNMVDFSQLAEDLAGNSLPDYAFIVPNAYHSAHGDLDHTGGPCANPDDILAEADCWLENEIDPLVKYLVANNGLMVMTWDEGDGADGRHGGGQVATVIVSSASIPGFRSTAFLRHQSSLRLTLEALGVADLPGAAKHARQMANFFN